MISIFSKLNAFKSGSNEVVLLLDSVLRRYVMLRFDFDVTKNFIELITFILKYVNYKIIFSLVLKFS